MGNKTSRTIDVAKAREALGDLKIPTTITSREVDALADKPALSADFSAEIEDRFYQVLGAPSAEELDEDTFIAAVYARTYASETEKRRIVFKMMDSNDKGYLDQKTLLQAMQMGVASETTKSTNSAPSKLSKLLADALVVAYDKDVDGRFEFDEFQRMADQDPMLLRLLQAM